MQYLLQILLLELVLYSDKLVVPYFLIFFSGTSLASGVSLVEFDFLKGQVKEWKEKYETIRIKRQVSSFGLRYRKVVQFSFFQLHRRLYLCNRREKAFENIFALLVTFRN